MTSSLLVYLIAIPLASSALLMVLGRKADKWGHVLGTLASASSFALGASLFFQMLGRPAEIGRAHV